MWGLSKYCQVPYACLLISCILCVCKTRSKTGLAKPLHLRYRQTVCSIDSKMMVAKDSMFSVLFCADLCMLHFRSVCTACPVSRYIINKCHKSNIPIDHTQVGQGFHSRAQDQGK